VARSNRFRDVAAGLWPDPPEKRLGLSLDVGTRQDPDQRAEAERLSRAAGVSIELAERNREEARRQARLRDLDPLALFRRAPETARALSDPATAAVAHDDAETLTRIEELVRETQRPSLSVGRLGRAAVAEVGQAAANKTLADLHQLGAKYADLDDPATLAKFRRDVASPGFLGQRYGRRFTDRLVSLQRDGLPEDEAARTAAEEILQAFRQKLGKGAADELPDEFKRSSGLLEDTVRALAGSAPDMLLAPVSPLGSTMGFTGTLAGGKLRELLPETDVESARRGARLSAVGQAPLEAAGSLLQLGALRSVYRAVGGKLAGAMLRTFGGEAAKTAGRYGGRELARAGGSMALAGAGEGLEEWLQNVPDRWGTMLAENPDADPYELFGKMLAEIPDTLSSDESLYSAVVGAAAGMVFPGIGGAVGTVTGIVNGTRQAARARRSRAFVEALGEEAGSSKLRERLPERFATLVERMREANGGPVEAVYVPAEKVVELFQGAPGEFLQGLPAEVVAQWDEGLATGGDLRFTVGQFAAHVAGTDAFAPLADHLRWGSPEAMTAAEAQAFQESLAEEIQAEHARSLAATEDLREDPADPITAEVSRMLAAAGRTPDVAQREARLLGVVFRTLGKRAGVAPEDLFRRWNLRVRGQLPETVTRSFSEMDLWVDRLRERLGGKVEKPAAPSLLQFLQSRGGVKDTGGELKAMDLQKARPGFVRKTSAPSGLDPDAAALAAWEAGYFTGAERPTPGTLFEAIRRELGGQLVLPLEADAKQAERQAILDDLERVLDDLGVDVRTATNEEVKAALEGITAKEGGELRQGPRASITFAPDETTINLFEKADLSSFLHEGAHLFMRQLQELAEMESAPEQLAKDWTALQAFTADEETETGKQETLARAFEAYLREGKAPSEELAWLFQRFRGWLLAVYRTLKGLNVELTNEVRGVFDRMLATDEEIAAQEARQRYDEMPGAEELLTPEELAAYRKQRAEATEAATRRLEEQKIRERLREATAEWKEEKARLTEEIAAMVNRRPVYQAIHWLTKGERLGGEEDGAAILPEHRRLDVDALRQMYGGGEILGYLNKAGGGLYGKDGVHPDEIAPLFGFGSGDELVQAILNAAPRRATIAEMVKQEMRERHGDLDARKDQAATAALEAVHGDERAKVLATEMAVLHRRAGQKAPAAAVLKAAAERIILSKLVKDGVAVNRYATAELRAARAAEKALAAGDLEEAAEQKRRQLLNHYLVKEAARARDEVRKAEKRILSTKKQASLDKLDQEARRQVLSILERIGVRTGVDRSQYETDREALPLWAQKQAEDGVDVYVHEWLLNERNALGEDQTWRRDLPLEVLVGVKHTLASFAKHAAKSRSLYLTGENLDAAATRLAAVIARNAKGGRGTDNLTPSGWDQLSERVGELEASATRMEFLFRRLDGGEVNGEVAQAIFQPFVEAENQKVERLAAAGKNLHDLFRRHYGKTGWELRARRRWNDALGKNVSKADLLALALNWGNEENRLAVVKGLRHLIPGDAQDASEALAVAAARVEEALGELTENDWAFVQEVWDLIDGYWPEIRQQQLDIVGVAPPKVQAAPVVIGGKTVARGGYYPLKYDSRASEKAERYKEKGEVTKLFENNFARAATAHGHTKARVGSGGQPVRLDLGVIAEHLDQVVHDLTHRKAVIDADRLLNRQEVQEAIIDAVGRPMYRQLRPWLHALANPDREAVTGWERILFHARHGTTVAMLGMAASTAVQQIGSWPVAIQALGPRYAASGLARFLGDAAKMGKATRFALASSGQLRHRMTTFDRDVRDFTKKLGPKGAFPEVHRFLFLFTGLMDMAVAVPTWLGGYQKAMAEGRGHEGAAAYADSIVRTTQGSGGVKDLAQLQRKEWLKLFTSFYSYFSNLANMMLEQVHETRREGIVKHLPELASFFLFSLAAPALVSELLAGRGPDDDEGEDWPEWALKNLGLYAVATVPLIRDVVRYAVDGRGRFEMAPAQRAFEAPANVLKDLPEVLDEGPDRWWAKNVVDTVGYWGALPSRQAWITGTALYDWLQGEDVEPSEFVLRRKPR